MDISYGALSGEGYLCSPVSVQIVEEVILDRFEVEISQAWLEESIIPVTPQLPVPVVSFNIPK